MLDKLIIEFDKALKVSLPHNLKNERPSPSKNADEPALNDSEKKHSQALMRINHTGEVMAQAMYQGQSLAAKSKKNKALLQHAAIEEIDHLTWCKERLDELNGSTSIFNPLWYGLSFSMGALAGTISDEVSLGFVAAVEDQVCIHLEEHLESLPSADIKSSNIVKQMLIDEEKHSQIAVDAGGKIFSIGTKKAMTGFSKAMTFLSYRI